VLAGDPRVLPVSTFVPALDELQSYEGNAQVPAETLVFRRKVQVRRLPSKGAARPQIGEVVRRMPVMWRAL
jgi:hypothetical protein